jgi:hypothetical protein
MVVLTCCSYEGAVLAVQDEHQAPLSLACVHLVDAARGVEGQVTCTKHPATINQWRRGGGHMTELQELVRQ